MDRWKEQRAFHFHARGITIGAGIGFVSSALWLARNPLDSNWVAALGQCLGALFTAVAAYGALQAVRATRDAALQQSRADTLRALLTQYAEPGLYLALQGFGRFVGEDLPHQFNAVAAALRDAEGARARCTALLGPPMSEDLDAILSRLGYPAARTAQVDPAAAMADRAKALHGHRRQIHHFFRLVWSLWKAGLLPEEDLPLITTRLAGYDLWWQSVLPVTLGVVRRQAEYGRPVSSSLDDWAWELLAVANTASRGGGGRR